MTVEACPHCDSTRFRQRLRVRNEFGIDNRGGDPTDRYYCDDCGNSFDEPNEREGQHPEGAGGKLHGLAKALDDADPDAIGGGSA